MPPKVIAAKAKAAGKAKALPKAKGKAKAKAKARGKAAPRPRRLRGGALRRPAAEIPEAEVDRPGTELSFEEGGVVNAEKVGGAQWKEGIFVAFERSYWQGPCDAAGVVRRYHEDAGKKEIELELKGTTSEKLLRWGSGHKLDNLRVHLSVLSQLSF